MLCMAMYGYVWLCRAVYGYVGLCSAMYGYVWLRLAVYDYGKKLDKELDIKLNMREEKRRGNHGTYWAL